MNKGLKICGISDPKTLNFILNHPYPPKFIGFITNYEKSIRYIEFNKLKELIKINRKKTSFVSVLVNPSDKILEKIKNLDFDFYQLYDVSPERTKEIKFKSLIFSKSLSVGLTSTETNFVCFLSIFIKFLNLLNSTYLILFS